MEASAVEDALALPPAALLEATGDVIDVMNGIMLMGGPGVASRVVVAFPAMARAGPRAWDLAWYYMVAYKYRIYGREWIRPFFDLRPQAAAVSDYWRRVYVCCSMLVRMAWVAVHQLLLVPEPMFALRADARFVEALGRVVVPGHTAKGNLRIDRFQFDLAQIAANRSLEDFAIDEYVDVANTEGVPVARVQEALTLPAMKRLRPMSDYLRQNGDDVHSDLALELVGPPLLTGGPPRALRATPPGTFRNLLAGVFVRRRMVSLYNFGDAFIFARRIDAFARTLGAEQEVILTTESSLDLVAFSAPLVLALLDDTRLDAAAWYRFAAAAESPSSSSVGNLLEQRAGVRFELRHLLLFGARKLEGPPRLELLIGREDSRPDWMEGLGLAVAKNSRASVTFGEPPYAD